MKARIAWRLPDALTAFLLFALAWTVYTLAPVTRIYDSRHALLVSEQLYREGNFRLDRYFPELAPQNERGEAWAIEPSDYRLHWVHGHLYYYFPPGSSLLSVPFIPVFHLFGRSPVGADGRPFLEKEQALQRRLAALLTALFVVLTFALARTVLPLSWSAFVALAMAFGTTALSTASRGLWSHTWGILLLSAAIFVCWRWMEQGWRPLAAALVATLLCWCFLVRPSFALSAAGIALFAALMRVRYWWLLPLVGLGWLTAFAAYSWTHLGTLLPPYFFASRLGGGSPAEALAGNLISPARGLLIFTPGLLCWIYFAVRYSRSSPWRHWMALAASLVAAHWLLISNFPHWWGGHSFGPRLMTDVLPWLALLGVLATRAWLDGQPGKRRRLELAALLLLWGISAAIHFSGALSFETQRWNVHPVNLDQHPERLWDWTDPQFLRPLKKR